MLLPFFSGCKHLGARRLHFWGLPNFVIGCSSSRIRSLTRHLPLEFLHLLLDLAPRRLRLHAAPARTAASHETSIPLLERRSRPRARQPPVRHQCRPARRRCDPAAPISPCLAPITALLGADAADRVPHFVHLLDRSRVAHHVLLAVTHEPEEALTILAQAARPAPRPLDCLTSSWSRRRGIRIEPRRADAARVGSRAAARLA